MRVEVVIQGVKKCHEFWADRTAEAAYRSALRGMAAAKGLPLHNQSTVCDNPPGSSRRQWLRIRSELTSKAVVDADFTPLWDYMTQNQSDFVSEFTGRVRSKIAQLQGRAAFAGKAFRYGDSQYQAVCQPDDASTNCVPARLPWNPAAVVLLA